MDLTQAYKQAERLDQEDALSSYRREFSFPKGKDGKSLLYFCGNSLGLMPKRASQYVVSELNDWGAYGVKGHSQKSWCWIDYPDLVKEPLAELCGGKANEVAAMGSLSANLHLLMVSFYQPKGERKKIMIEKDAFPSDRYAVQSQLAFHGAHPEADLIELAPREGEDALRAEDILRSIEENGDQLALILLGGVNYLTGQVFPMKAIVEKGHAVGAKVGFDLAHGIGNIELCLHDWQVDFAAWCHYKYVNASPGAIAGIFVHERHFQAPLPRFAGWWGSRKADRFKMLPDFQPETGAGAWQLSNPAILPLAALRGSLELFSEVGMRALVKKSRLMTGFMAELLEMTKLKDRLLVMTPKELSERGCQWSFRVLEEPQRVQRVLEERGVICDFREPNVVRVSPVPFYNRFDDLVQFVDIISSLYSKNPGAASS